MEESAEVTLVHMALSHPHKTKNSVRPLHHKTQVNWGSIHKHMQYHGGAKTPKLLKTEWAEIQHSTFLIICKHDFLQLISFI